MRTPHKSGHIQLSQLKGVRNRGAPLQIQFMPYNLSFNRPNHPIFERLQINLNDNHYPNNNHCMNNFECMLLIARCRGQYGKYFTYLLTPLCPIKCPLIGQEINLAWPYDRKSKYMEYYEVVAVSIKLMVYWSGLKIIQYACTGCTIPN